MLDGVDMVPNAGVAYTMWVNDMHGRVERIASRNSSFVEVLTVAEG